MRFSNSVTPALTPPSRYLAATSALRDRSGRRSGLPEKPKLNGKYRSLKLGALKAVPAPADTRHAGVNCQP